MENYIVRIYRRDINDRSKVTGLVESVERDTRHTFHHLNSLRSFLMEEPPCNSSNTVSTGNDVPEPQLAVKRAAKLMP